MKLHRRLDWEQQHLRRWSEEDNNIATTDDDKTELAASLLDQEGPEVPMKMALTNGVDQLRDGDEEEAQLWKEMLQSVSEEASSHRGKCCSPEPKKGRDDVAEDDLKE